MDSKKLNDKSKVKELVQKFEKEIQKARKGREENRKLKEGKMVKIMKEKKKLSRGLPAELLNEMFDSLPLQNALGLLAKMPNGILARDVQKMVNSIKMVMKENKWNKNDCGPKLAIFEDGFPVNHSLHYVFPSDKVNSVRANFPIPAFKLDINKPAITFYFELEILKKIRECSVGIGFCGECSVGIGFCGQEFPLEGECLGYRNNSIGIDRKGGIWADGHWIGFKSAAYEYIEEGDLIGIGIIHLPNSVMKCFATCNGKLIGLKVELPAKFATFPLFPAVNLYCGESIRANFGKNEWLFKEFDCVLQ